MPNEHIRHPILLSHRATMSSKGSPAKVEESSFKDSIQLTFVGLAEALFTGNSHTVSWKYPYDQLSEIHVSIPRSTCLRTFIHDYWDSNGHHEMPFTVPLALFARGVRLDENATPESAELYYKNKVVVLPEVSYAF